MQDEHAHFLVIVGDICSAARLAGLPVKVLTRQGTSFVGIPEPRSGEGVAEVDHTGWGKVLYVGEERVDLEAVAEISIERP